MARKTYAVSGKAANPTKLQAAMRAANWPTAGCSIQTSTPPKTYADVLDTELDPTTFIQNFQSIGILKVTSNAAPGPDGVPACPADGVATQTLTIQNVDQYSGQVIPSGITVLPLPSHMMTVAPQRPQLVNGVATCVVGPSPDLCDVIIKFCDQAGNVGGASIHIQFV